MKFCLSGNSVEVPNLNGDTPVSDVIAKLVSLQQFCNESIILIHKGRLLDATKQLKDYDLDDSSIIHVVILKDRKDADDSACSTSPKWGESSISSCSVSNHHTGKSEMISIFAHIFGDVINSCDPPEPPVQLRFEDVTAALKDDPSILSSAVQTPLYQDILSDIPFMRKLLLANPVIEIAIERNPKLLSFIEDDESLQELSSVLLNPRSFHDIEFLKQMVVQKIERRIGDRIPPPLPPEIIAQEISEKTGIPVELDPNPVCNLWSLRPTDTAERVCRDDHIELLCQIIANRPDIVMHFMKNTPLYRVLYHSKPELLREAFKPERLKLLAKPEMVKTLIKVDKALLKLIDKQTDKSEKE